MAGGIMRHTFGVMILVGNLYISNLAIATNWVQVEVDDIATTYIDADNVKREDNMVKFWSKGEFKEAQTIGKTVIKSVLTYEYIDCKDRTWGHTEGVFRDSEGNIELSQEFPLNMKPIPPESLGEKYLNLLCVNKHNSATASNWIFIGKPKDDRSWYIDKESIKRKDSAVTYWVKTVCSSLCEGLSGIKYKEMIDFVYIDCKEKTSGITTEVMYNEVGDVIQNKDYPLKMNPIVPDTMGEYEFNLLCK